MPQHLMPTLTNLEIPDKIQFDFSSRKARNQQYSMIALNPFVKVNGQIRRIQGFDVNYAFAKAPTAQNRLPIVNSVLSEGSIYKFFVEETGVHRITRSFLQSIGMSTSNINPRQIKVYGYGGAPLPFLNSENTEFDLRELAIKVVGEEDGSLMEMITFSFMVKVQEDIFHKWIPMSILMQIGLIIISR